jgi:hypothetical protein
MNTIVTLAIAWVFAFAEDIWFNRLLTYQLSGDAERKGASDRSAIDAFNRRKGRFSWVALAIGLTMVVLSFPRQFTVSASGLLFAVGVGICVSYIGYKIFIYQKASRNLDQD